MEGPGCSCVLRDLQKTYYEEHYLNSTLSPILEHCLLCTLKLNHMSLYFVMLFYCMVNKILYGGVMGG